VLEGAGAVPPACRAKRFSGHVAQSLTTAAAEKLRSLLLRGEIEPDTHLQEAHVARLLGMSRTPVRSALAELANEGLLVPGPWRGYKVRRFTLNEVADAYAVRATLEAQACRALAENGISDEARDGLRAIIEGGDKLLTVTEARRQDIRGWMHVNDLFHARLAAECGNDLLRRMIELTQRIPLVHRGFVGAYQFNDAFLEHVRQGQAEHHRILLAIEQGQSSRAGELMREHIISAETWSVDAAFRNKRPKSAGTVRPTKTLCG
jgi:GntR family transcriptional regulator, vanillate catabolism transcriptional regulator